MQNGSTLVWVALALATASCSGPPPGTPVAPIAPQPDAAAAPASEPGWTGITEPEEVIEARRALMDEARRTGHTTVELSAQTHARAFYERHGFSAYGPEYDDAGIPHVMMRRAL